VEVEFRFRAKVVFRFKVQVGSATFAMWEVEL
jgi:hypothetical protein